MLSCNVLRMHRKSRATASFDPSSSAAALRARAPANGIPASGSLLSHVHIVMPPHANHMGNMFGGIYMEYESPLPPP